MRQIRQHLSNARNNPKVKMATTIVSLLGAVAVLVWQIAQFFV